MFIRVWKRLESDNEKRFEKLPLDWIELNGRFSGIPINNGRHYRKPTVLAEQIAG